MRIRAEDALWMAAGAGVLLVLGALVLLFGGEPKPDPRVAAKAERVGLVDRMQLGLASASEFEKSAVMAITDPESQAFADQARAAAADVEQERAQLAALLDAGGTQRERALLAEFSQHFAELQRIDGELLDMAAKNTNLRASALASGPAADALDAMGAALDRLVSAHADAADAKQVMSLAHGAEIGALRIQTLLPAHIAESSDEKMDALEARMARHDAEVRADLEHLGALPKLAGAADLAEAAAQYEQFRALESQILALSRENTNVRSLSISLNEKRRAMLVCQDALSDLEKAIADEPIETTYGWRFRVR